MLKTIVANTEWARFYDLISPSFFDVLPLGELLRQAKDLASSYFDGKGFAAATATRARTLTQARVPVALETTAAQDLAHHAAGSAPAALTPAERGERILELFFHQIFAEGPLILDLRSERFEAGADGALIWRPRPLFVVFEPAFRQGVQDLYDGFYGGKRESFERAVEALGIACAEPEMRRHFAGDVRAQRFSVREFQASFHDVFVRVREGRSRLHRNFLPLGFYLAALYENLERTGAALDVQGAYERARARLAPGRAAGGPG